MRYSTVVPSRRVKVRMGKAQSESALHRWPSSSQKGRTNGKGRVALSCSCPPPRRRSVVGSRRRIADALGRLVLGCTMRLSDEFLGGIGLGLLARESVDALRKYCSSRFDLHVESLLKATLSAEDYEIYSAFFRNDDFA